MNRFLEPLEDTGNEKGVDLLLPFPYILKPIASQVAPQQSLCPLQLRAKVMKFF